MSQQHGLSVWWSLAAVQPALLHIWKFETPDVDPGLCQGYGKAIHERTLTADTRPVGEQQALSAFRTDPGRIIKEVFHFIGAPETTGNSDIVYIICTRSPGWTLCSTAHGSY